MRGTTDTDYFYFLCPICPDKQITRVLDYKITHETPAIRFKDLKPKAKRDFVISFELYCENCKHIDYVKVSNIGWQGGSIEGSPHFGEATTDS